MTPQTHSPDETLRRARSVCHDFNNHLTVIRTFSELIEDALPETDPLRSFSDLVLKSTDGAVSSLQELVAILEEFPREE